MKILQVNVVCGVGSTGRIATDIHEMLITQSHESAIAYGREPAKNCDNAIRVGRDFDFYLHAIGTRLFDAHGFFSAAATKNFIKQVEILNPDVIHLHNLHGYYLHLGVLFEYLKSANKPIIWTLHDCWAFTGHCSHFDYVGCVRWKTECHNCPAKSEYPQSLLIDNSRWNYQRKKTLFTGLHDLTIVVPSEWLASLVKQSFLREYTVKVVNNGVDLDVFRPVPGGFRIKHGLLGKFIILGVASNFGIRKGYDYFLELSKGLMADEVIVMVGLAQQQLRSLPPSIIGIAKTENVDDLAEIYSEADVLLNPTLEDCFPTVNLEALACGTPVITFDSGGSPECVDASCGVVVRRGDVAGLLAAVAIVKEHGKQHYATHCRERAQERYNKDARFAEYIDLYREVLHD